MSAGYSTQALQSSNADLITSLSFSSSSPSLLVSTSLDGWIRIHARQSTRSSNLAKGSSWSRTNGQNDHDMNGDENDEEHSDEQDEWAEVGSSKANEGPVWKAIWGPREYGTSLLVSIAGSVVHVWETQEQQADGEKKLALQGRASLVEARGSMRDIAFTPSEFGLKLASIAADSHLRVYECLDPSSAGLATWSLLEDIDLLSLPNAYYTPASTSQPSQHHQQTQLIKGFDDNQSNGSSRGSALGPSGGSSASLGAQSASSNASATKGAGRIESSGAWAIAYCQEAWWGECLAVSAGREGLVRIMYFTPSSYWSQIAVLTPPGSGTASPVSTIAWAASCGRSYHLIASGARDGCVRIWKVTPSNEAGKAWEASLAAEITEHMDGSSGGVGKVEWNITGTILSTAGCDGVVRLWKAGYSGEWRMLSSITCDGQGEEGSSKKR